MTYGTDKIDIHGQHRLSDNQCDIATAIWAKYGVFDKTADSSKATRKRFGEEAIWNLTFYNFDITDVAHCRKLKKLTRQIIDRHKDVFGHNAVDRIDYHDADGGWCIICKPDMDFARRRYSTSVCSAATNMVKAEHINDGFNLDRRTFGDIMQKVDTKVESLQERRVIFDKWQRALDTKIKDLDNLIGLTQPPIQIEEYDDDEDEDETDKDN